MGVIKRGNVLWIRFQDHTGKWRSVSSGHVVGEERQAQAKYDELMRQVAEMPASGGTLELGAMTVRRYAAQWIPKRRAEDLDWKNDESRLRIWVLPTLGDMPIAEVRTRHLVDLFSKIRTKPREGRDDVAAPRLVYNIYSVVSAMFRDAQIDDVIASSPCVLDDRQLGPLKDKDPEWRESAVFTREEATTLLSDARIPLDRQLVYAFELLAGMRPGEGAALRWRHYDPTKQPLGKLTVAHAYNTRKNRAKGTKTDTVRSVPVHPTLAAMLAEWKLHGWQAMHGRAPTDEDLIVPLPPDAAARRRTRTGEPFRGHDYSGKRWREEDLPALGWRHRQHYDMKSTFISLVLEDGADPEIIESRVTHTKKKRGAFHGYDRGRDEWPETCAEVAKLRLYRGPQAIAKAAGDGHTREPVTVAVTVRASRDDNEGKGVEAAGVEGAHNSTPRGSVDDSITGYPQLALVRVSTERMESESRVTDRDDDVIATALEAALATWRGIADGRSLRRALLKVLADLDDE